MLFHDRNRKSPEVIQTIWLSGSGTTALPFMVELKNTKELYKNPALAIIIDEFIVDGNAQPPSRSDVLLDNMNLDVFIFENDAHIYLVPITQLYFAAEKNDPRFVINAYAINAPKLIKISYRLRTPSGVLDHKYLLNVISESP
jgi:hypothetical protein